MSSLIASHVYLSLNDIKALKIKRFYLIRHYNYVL